MSAKAAPGPLTLQLVSGAEIVGAVKLSPREHRRLALFAERNGASLGGMVKLAFAFAFASEAESFDGSIIVPEEVTEEDERRQRAGALSLN